MSVFRFGAIGVRSLSIDSFIAFPYLSAIGVFSFPAPRLVSTYSSVYNPVSTVSFILSNLRNCLPVSFLIACHWSSSAYCCACVATFVRSLVSHALVCCCACRKSPTMSLVSSLMLSICSAAKPFALKNFLCSCCTAALLTYLGLSVSELCSSCSLCCCATYFFASSSTLSWYTFSCSFSLSSRNALASCCDVCKLSRWLSAAICADFKSASSLSF